MFDKFGEFNSVEELNQAAEGQKAQGDLEALKLLAKENGIDESMAEMFMEGMIPMLADTMTAAIGKLDIEIEEAKKEPGMAESIEAMAQYLQAHCDEKELATQIRSKGKSIVKAAEEIRKEAEKRAKEKKGMVCVHIPPAEVYQMLRKYYAR